MGFKRELFVYILITFSSLLLFSWHEDNYYRQLLKKSAQMAMQEERFFFEIQDEVLQLTSEISNIKQGVLSNQETLQKIQNVVMSKFASDHALLDASKGTSNSLSLLRDDLHRISRSLRKLGQRILNDTNFDPIERLSANLSPDLERARSLRELLDQLLIPPPPDVVLIGRGERAFFVDYLGDQGSSGFIPETVLLETNFEWSGMIIQNDGNALRELRDLNLNVWLAPVCLSSKDTVEPHYHPKEKHQGMRPHVCVSLKALVSHVNMSRVDYLRLGRHLTAKEVEETVMKGVPYLEEKGMVRVSYKIVRIYCEWKS